MDPHYNELGTQAELAVILSHYESTYIYDIVNSHIDMVLSTVSNLISSPPNVIGAWEQNFKAIIDQYGSEDLNKIQEVRLETYREVINIICNRYCLNFTIDENIDLYSAAYTMYDVFICNLSSNIINFFGKFIYNQKEEIFTSMNLDEVRLNRDNSTVYSRHTFKDIKLATINANIFKVLENIIKSMDFTFETFIFDALDNPTISNYITTIVSDNGGFYQNIPLKAINTNMVDYITGIRFKIQELALNHNDILYTNAESANSGIEAEDYEGV